MKKFNFIIWTIYVITFCFSLFLCSSVYSQVINTAFERITTKDGLPQSTVNYIIQDKKGFMWFATFGGICRYDGYTFKVYSHIADDKTSLSNNGIIYFFEDRDGYIWIANNANEGLDKFDPVNESFTNYKNDPKDSTSISSDEVYSVYQDRSGNIWVFTANALNLVVNKKIGNKTVIRFKRFYNTSNTIPFNMGYEDSSGKLLLFADHLYYFNRGNNEILKTDVMLAQSTIKSIGKDREGNLWLGTSLNGMIKLIYNKKTGGYKRADLGKVNVTPNNRNYILIDNQDNIWIATESKGLFQYIEKEGRLINIVNNKIDLNSISDNTIYSLYIDRSGVFWIGTFSQGLCKYNLFEKPFYHFKSIPGDDNTLSGNVISSIHSTIPGELWVGVDLDGGINRFVFRDNKEPEVFHYMHDPKNGNSIGGNSILCLVQRKNGEVWAGSAGGSVSKIIPEKYGSNKKPVITRYSFYRWTFSIFEDRQGTIWGGTWDGGLWRYHEKTDLVTFFQNDPDNPSSLCDNIIWAITEDNSENIWIGGHGEGLSILPAKEKNKPNPEFINFKHEEENIQSLSNNTIHVFCQDHTGTMWIGTASGLNKVIRRDNNFSDIDTDHELKFFSYHINDGLPSDNILGIVQDNNGNLWLSTSNGISKFNLSENSFTNYYESDGLQSNEFWHNAYFKDQSGKLYLGGNNGFNAFYPDSIKPNPFPPRVVFTDFRLFYKSVKIGEKINDDIILSKSINETSEIVLSHRNNIFSIEFAALQYAHPDKNKYAYKMEGFNKEWVETSADFRSASYTNLPPGQYTFKAKASNNDGVWNEEGASIKVVITPPFWERPWFRGIVLVLSTGIAIAGYKTRTARMRAANRDLERRVKERTSQLEATNKELEAFSYSVSHDLRAPLRAMDGFSQALLEDYQEKLDKIGRDYLHRIRTGSQHMGRLIDDLLKLSRLTRNQMHYQKIDLGRLAELMAEDFRKTQPERKVEFIIEKPIWVMGDPSLFKVMLWNLMDNAWKFTSRKSEAKIEFGTLHEKGERIYYMRDNGVGFDMNYSSRLFEAFQRQHTDYEGTGIGLTTVQRIIHRHGGRIWAEGKMNEGAIFYFTLKNPSQNTAQTPK